MTNSAVAVANYFVRKSLETGKELTPMKVLKLVYIAHGWNLALYDEPLISDSIQAWKFGPVIPSVYQAFRVFRNSQITMMSHTQGTLNYQKKTLSCLIEYGMSMEIMMVSNSVLLPIERTPHGILFGINKVVSILSEQPFLIIL